MAKEVNPAVEPQTPLPHGVVPDQVQVNQNLAQADTELTALRAKFDQTLKGFDWSIAAKHLERAQVQIRKYLGQ